METEPVLILECVGGPLDGERWGKPEADARAEEAGAEGRYQRRRYVWPDGRDEDVYEWQPGPDWLRDTEAPTEGET